MNDSVNQKQIINLTFFAILILGLLRINYIMSGGIERLVTFIPDDGFYCLVLAKNFIKYGIWTFDGVAPASGFQILSTYLLALIYSLNISAGLESIFLYYSILNLIFITISYYLILKISNLLENKNITIIYLLFLPTLYTLTTNFLESSLVVLLSVITVFFYCIERINYKNLILLFITGFVGTLVRVDYGLIPLSLAIGALIYSWPNIRSASVLKAIAPLFGASFGVLFISAHTYLISQSFVQNSVAIKSHWGALLGLDLIPPIKMMGATISPLLFIPTPELLYKYLKSLLLMFTLIIVIAILLKNLTKINLKKYDLILFCIISLFGYAIAYSFNPAVQNWYSAVFVTPLIIFLFVIIKINNFNSWKFLNKLLFGSIFIINYFACFVPQYPWQIEMLEAGKYVKDNRNLGLVGSWNSGIIGFISGGGVVNLDGLVNDEIYNFIIQDNAVGYIKQRKINTLIDYNSTIDVTKNQILNGYSNNKLNEVVLEREDLNFNKWAYSSNNIVLLRLKPIN